MTTFHGYILFPVVNLEYTIIITLNFWQQVDLKLLTELAICRSLSSGKLYVYSRYNSV